MPYFICIKYFLLLTKGVSGGFTPCNNTGMKEHFQTLLNQGFPFLWFHGAMPCARNTLPLVRMVHQLLQPISPSARWRLTLNSVCVFECFLFVYIDSNVFKGVIFLPSSHLCFSSWTLVEQLCKVNYYSLNFKDPTQKRPNFV